MLNKAHKNSRYEVNNEYHIGLRHFYGAKYRHYNYEYSPVLDYLMPLYRVSYASFSLLISALVRRTDLKYFTRIRSEKETEIIRTKRSQPKGQFVVKLGELKVTETITGYEKRRVPGQELIGAFPLDLPPQTFETVGLWVEIEAIIEKMVKDKNLHFMGGIHAIEHTAISLFPLFALCDRMDIGGISYTFHPQLRKSAIFIYDGYPGGVGLAQRGFDIILELLGQSLDLIKGCPCEQGCPSCIYSPRCGSGQ